MKTLEEIFELDKARTPYWKHVLAGYNDGDPWIKIVLNRKINGYPLEVIATDIDYRFIAAAPDMVSHLRALLAKCERYSAALSEIGEYVSWQLKLSVDSSNRNLEGEIRLEKISERIQQALRSE